MIGLASKIKKMVNYLTCIKGKVGLKDIHCIAQNVALIVDLLKNTFWLIPSIIIICLTTIQLQA